MKQTALVRCPACWTPLVEPDGPCPGCGRSPTQPPRRVPVSLVLLLGVAIGGGAVWLATRRSAPAHEPAATPAPEPRAVASEPAPTVAAPARHVLRVHVGDQPLAMLLLRAPSGRLAGLLALATLPLRGDLSDAERRPWPLEVLAVSEAYGFLLVEVPREAGPLAESKPLAPRAQALPVEAQLRTPEGVVVAVANYEGSLLALSGEVEAGQALLDDDGAAAALGLGGRHALPVSQAYPFLASPAPPRSFADARRELRARDAVALLEDVAAEINGTESAAATRAALERLELNYALARGPELVAAYERALRDGHRMLARRLAAADAAAGYAHARANAARFVGDLDVLADAVVLAASAGEHFAAADLWLELASRDQARAAAHAEGLEEALTRAANAQVGVQPRQAAELLARAVDLFPDRAALRMSYANALLMAGDGFGALAQARAAAQLDPSLGERADAIAGRLASGASSVEIPIDGASHVVRAACSLAGQPLEFVVDTGASITIVPTSYLALGTRTGRQMRIQTASGMVEGELLRLADLKIGGITMHSVQAVAIDLPGTLAGKGLLGMNVLRRLNLELDGRRGMLVLRR